MAERKYLTLEEVRKTFLPSWTFEKLDGEQTGEQLREELLPAIEKAKIKHLSDARLVTTNNPEATK